MTKRIALAALALIVALLVVPVAAQQLLPDEDRSLDGVSLEETSFEEVGFTNEEHDLDLAGLLFVPDGAGPHPAVVVIHGSGTSHRDNSWYLTFADYLQQNGVAVLLPDKRGSEASEGDWHTSSFEDLAADAASAVTFLRQGHPETIGAIGVLGMSQGGVIAPLVPQLSEDVSFVVNVVGGTVPMHDTLVYEEQHNLREMGLLPGFSHAIAPLSSYYIRAFAQEEFWTAIGNFDPLPHWRELEAPALVLYGSDDTNVPTDESAERLQSLDKPNIEVIVYEGSGHGLSSPDGEGEDLVREDALEAVRDFIATAAPHG